MAKKDKKSKKNKETQSEYSTFTVKNAEWDAMITRLNAIIDDVQVCSGYSATISSSAVKDKLKLIKSTLIDVELVAIE